LACDQGSTLTCRVLQGLATGRPTIRKSSQGRLHELENTTMKSDEATQLIERGIAARNEAQHAAPADECGVAGSISDDLKSFTVHCYAVVRIKFPGVLANSAKEAAERVMDRFDWDAYGQEAEFADHFTGALVDVDGDDEYLQSVVFDSQLQEVKE
jgi:hypothetical protein